MTDKTFCHLHNGYFGEDIDSPKQIKKIVFTGEELKEYIEMFVKEVNLLKIKNHNLC